MCHQIKIKIYLKYLTVDIFCKLNDDLSFLDLWLVLQAKKSTALGGASQKSLWTDRVNVQEVKKQ